MDQISIKIDVQIPQVCIKEFWDGYNKNVTVNSPSTASPLLDIVKHFITPDTFPYNDCKNLFSDHPNVETFDAWLKSIMTGSYDNIDASVNSVDYSRNSDLINYLKQKHKDHKAEKPVYNDDTVVNSTTPVNPLGDFFKLFAPMLQGSGPTRAKEVPVVEVPID